MANVGVSAIKLIDRDGDALDDGAGKLNVAISDGTNTLSISQQSESVVDYGIGIMGEAKVVDGNVFPNSVAEGEAVRLASSRGGILYTCLTTDGGLKSAVETDDSGQEALPAMVNVGGEYRASATTYTDGDAAILQTDINGHLKIASTGTTIATFPQFDVDTSALQLTHEDALDTAGVTTTAKEIIIQCAFANTGYVMVGDSGLVADTDGIRLEAGDTLTLAATTTANIYVRGSANDQLVNVMIIS